jgi:hypothetical protein
MLRGTPSHRVRWAHADVIEARLRKRAALHDVTVNDVCLAGLAGAFGQWYCALSPTQSRPPDLSVLLPMSFREDGDQYAVGTRVASHRLELPCRSRNLDQAVRRVHRQTVAMRTQRIRDASRLALRLLPVTLAHRMAAVALGATSARLFTSSITLSADFTCLGRRLSAASLVCDLYGGRMCYVSFTRAAGVVRCGVVFDEALRGASALPGLWRDAVGADERPNAFPT